MAEQRHCVLYDRECIGCGECDRCDLDPEKICDNCMKCVMGDAEYRGVSIDGIVIDPDENRTRIQDFRFITYYIGLADIL